jgi:hypothetical protein
MSDDNGKSKGGYARAHSLSPEQRSAIAQRAARAKHDMLRATHGSADRPLRIGDVEIPCYVLSDGKRVLTQGGFTSALGMARGGSMIAGMNRLQLFVSRKSINPYISDELAERFANPLKFVLPDGTRANGFEAVLLADLCEAVLRAREAGGLQPQQQGIAAKCEILVRGFARVGIVALVDEATGYQADRARDALAKILEAFIAKELQPWVRTFPIDYYRELFRLRGLPFPSDTVRRPQYFGTLTNDIVYMRLAPGVLNELRSVTPKDDETGRYRHKFFQRLTTNTGYPKLREHLGSVVTLMKLSRDYRDFKEKLDRLHTKFGDTLPLPFEYDDAEDDGKGI